MRSETPIGHGEIMEMAREAEKQEAEKELRKLFKDYWLNQYLFLKSGGRRGGSGEELAQKLVAATKYAEEFEELFSDKEMGKIQEEVQKEAEEEAKKTLEEKKVV